MLPRSFAFFIVLFLLLFDLSSVSAQNFSSFNFPAFSTFPFPSKTPKPTPTSQPSSTPVPSSPASIPSSSPVPTVLEIDDIDPTSADFMEEFIIYGGGFGTTPGSVNFRNPNQSFSSGGAVVVSWSEDEITATVPALKKGSYRIQVVTSDNKKSAEEKFTVRNGQPIINSTSLSNNNGKWELTFQGSEFGRRGTMDIYKGDSFSTKGIIKSWTSSRIRFEIPAIPHGEYGFQITTADGRKSSLKFFTVGN